MLGAENSLNSHLQGRNQPKVVQTTVVLKNYNEKETVYFGKLSRTVRNSQQ